MTPTHHNGINKTPQLATSKFTTTNNNKSLRNHSEGSAVEESNEGTLHETKNGLLIHSQSTPGFPSLQGTPFLLGPTGTNGLVNGSPYIATIPSVSPFLVNLDGNKLLEQQQQQHMKREEEGEKIEEKEREEGEEGKTTTTRNKREEFIREAQEWSKQVGSKIKSNFDSNSSSVDNGTPPLIPLNATRQFQVCSAPIATPTSPNQSPLYQQAYILASPHHSSNGIFSVVSPTTTTTTGTILPPPPSSLSFLPKTMDTPASVSLNGIIARPVATPSLTTPTLATSGQKFMYVLQDGKLVTAPFDSTPPREGMSKRSPKRCGSPNSDPECSRPLKQRRRSSSLPDVNQLKCSPSPSPPPSPSPQDHTPLSHQSIVSFVGGSQATPPIFFSNMHLPQTTTTATVSLEHSDNEMGGAGDNLPPSPRVDINLHPGMSYHSNV